ncbi:amidohydrolase family protein [Paraburkholderia sp. J41]|uniref:amidohydrolase family protein n=1 Tax=Paraburkholderia sp. J41 TaxID=2805433 RepID=UPI002AC33CE4|nr:amidohydrolase family protein [Paraburkholderia sp. J41]
MNSEKPVFFDSHAHLVADDQTRYPRNPIGPNPNSPKRPPGTVGIPGGHHGPHPVHEVPDTSRMLQWMQEENVAGAVAVQKRMIYRYDNSYILDSCDRYPDLLTPVIIPDAEDTATPDFVRNCAQHHGLSGVRLFGLRQTDGATPWLNSAQALKTWDVAQAFGLVMDLEIIARGGAGDAIPTVLELSRAYPDVPIVLDHMLEPEVVQAGFGLDRRYEALAGQTSVFLKFTSINLDVLRESGVDAAPFLRRAVDMFGAHQIMWGSDIGTSSGSYKEMVSRMVAAAAQLDDDEKRAIYGETGRRVFLRGGQKSNAARTIAEPA